MGITTENYFEYIYSAIFSPKKFFSEENSSVSVRLSIGTIVVVSIISQTGIATANKTIFEELFVLSLIWKIICTIFFWFLTGLFFEYTAKIFGKGGNLNRILFFSGFASIPYIFYAPLNLLKDTGVIGYYTASGTEFLLYMWIIFLYAYSIKASYNISMSRSFMLISLPFVGLIFAFCWTIGFFTKLWYIFSI